MPHRCGGCLADITISITKAPNESLDDNCVAFFPLQAPMLWQLPRGHQRLCCIKISVATASTRADDNKVSLSRCMPNAAAAASRTS